MIQDSENCSIARDIRISIVLKMLKEGKQIKIAPHGFSMYPYIVSDRDELILTEPKRPYRRGDIVLYRRDNGVYVVHRIYRINKKKKQYYMLGDSQREIEGPLRENQLLALAITLIRNKREISMDYFWYKVSYQLWFIVRIFRKKLIKLWRTIRHLFGKKEDYSMPW